MLKIKLMIGTIILFISLTLLGSYIVYYYSTKDTNEILIENYSKNSHLEEKNEYLGILEIPKIKLKRGFYNLENINNTVNKNIELIKGSIMPNEENSILTLAAHSGNSNIGFFKNLSKLEVDDELMIYYLNNKYNYKIIDKYEVIKNGKININKDKGLLVLTTCSKNSNRQLVIIGKKCK